MRLATKIIVGAAVVAAAVTAASFGASAPAAASEARQAAMADAVTDMSARKRRHQATSLRVTKLSRRATEPPNPNRTYYRPVPNFFPFAQDRGYF